MQFGRFQEFLSHVPASQSTIRYEECLSTPSFRDAPRFQDASMVRGGCREGKQGCRMLPRGRMRSRGGLRALAMDEVDNERSEGASEQTSDDAVDESQPPPGIWGGQENEDVSFRTIGKFIIPTLCMWLAWPILSLVDAGVVGTRSSVELASLGPATVLCDSLIYCISFLAVATTNLQATALANKDMAEAQKVVAQALGLALVIGVACTLFVQVLGHRILLQLAGEKGKQVLPAALVYSRVRILGAPAAAADMVLQAACLGARDSLTPMGVVLVSGILNAFGDWLTVCRLDMGVFGAAAATATSEVVSMSLLGLAVLRAQGTRLYRFVAFPSREELKVFLTFAGPIAFALIGKVMCYSAMTLACTALGTIPLATHNVMLRIFFFFATFGEALSQTAQTFIPGQLAREKSLLASAGSGSKADSGLVSSVKNPGRKLPLSPARSMMRKILLLGVVVGGVCAGVAGLVPVHLPHLFTNSADVTEAMRELSALLSWSLLTHACVMGLEGILVARRRLQFLAKCYAVNTVILAAFMRSVSTWSPARGLKGAWVGLLLLQLLRLVEFGSHLLWLKRHDRIKGGISTP